MVLQPSRKIRGQRLAMEVITVVELAAQSTAFASLQVPTSGMSRETNQVAQTPTGVP